MKNKILILFINLLICDFTYAKPNIVVSITPIASLISMLTQGEANIRILDISGGCPHHHHAKPSDKSLIENAQMLVYIDEDFDGIATSVLHDYSGTKIRISNFLSIDFRGSDGTINWHFWLDLNNVKELQKEIAAALIQTFPEIKNEVQKNLSYSIEKIDVLAKIKSSLHFASTALLSDSLEHFFKSLKNEQLRIFQTSNTSLKNMQQLNKTLNSDSVKCIVLDPDQDASSYSKYNKIIIQLDSENWALPDNADDISDLFINKYTKMIDQMKGCR